MKKYYKKREMNFILSIVTKSILYFLKFIRGLVIYLVAIIIITFYFSHESIR